MADIKGNKEKHGLNRNKFKTHTHAHAHTPRAHASSTLTNPHTTPNLNFLSSAFTVRPCSRISTTVTFDFPIVVRRVVNTHLLQVALHMVDFRVTADKYRTTNPWLIKSEMSSFGVTPLILEIKSLTRLRNSKGKSSFVQGHTRSRSFRDFERSKQ